MAWNKRSSISDSVTGTSHANTPGPFTVSSGDLLVMCIGVSTSDTVTITSVTDTHSHTWTRQIRSAANGKFAEIWTTFATSASAPTITVNYSGSVTSQIVYAAFYRDGGTPTAVYAASSNTNTASTATSHPCGSVNYLSGDLLLTASSVATAFSPTVASGYTSMETPTRLYAQWQGVSGSGSDTATWTSAATEDTTSCQAALREGDGSSSPLTDGKIIFQAR